MLSFFAAPVAFPAPAVLPHEDLLREPTKLLSGPLSETWRAGNAANRRYKALRRALGAHLVTRSTSKASGFKTIDSSATVEIRYSVPRWVTAPAIEAREAGVVA